MSKSWLMCVLLGTLAWGQAAPSAPPPGAPGAGPGNAMTMARPQAPQAPPDMSASVPDTAAVITIIGVCPPKPVAAKGTAAKPAAKTSATKTPATDCKTVVTKAQFESLAKALVPNVTPQAKKQLAGILPNYIALSSAAKKQGLDKTEQFKLTVEFAKMQILAKELQKKVADDAAKVTPEQIEDYYKEHADAFEQFNLDRMFVPRTKQPSAEDKAEAKEEDKDKNLSEDAKKAKEAEEKAKADQAEQEMTKLAESLRARAAAGEDFVKLQKEAFDAAGMKIESPTVNLPTVRRTGLQAGHAAVFDLKPGDVSQVINDAGGHYIYKVNSKDEMTLEQATNEIRTKLQQDHTRDMMDKLNSSFKIETNDTYFPGGVSAAPPPRVPRPRPGMPPPGAGPNGAPPTQPQTPPPAQPPAPKPN